MRDICCDLAVDMTEKAVAKKGIREERLCGKYGVVRENIFVSEGTGERNARMKAGRYVCLTRKSARKESEEEKSYFTRSLSKAFLDILQPLTEKERPSVLVIGLGNGFMTTDALGKRVSEKIIATRGLSEDLSLGVVSSFAAGVSGMTGIESYEVVRGIVGQVRPDVLVLVDSLCAFRADRIGRCYQISDAGLRAGGGAGRPSRVRLDRETLRLPVVSVGVPFVISARHLLREIGGGEPSFDPALFDGDMFVCPREIDSVLTEASETVAAALNYALQPKLSYSDVLSFMT